MAPEGRIVSLAKHQHVAFFESIDGVKYLD